MTTDQKDDLFVFGIIAASIAVVLATVVAVFLIILHFDPGPRDTARKRFYQAQERYYMACEKQFKAGVFSAECVSAMRLPEDE